MNNLLASQHNLKLRNIEDALDVMGSGLPGCIFTLDDLGPDFFNLRNRIAGEAFQKFVNYRFPVAIVLPADHGLGDRVTELAREHARHNCVRFCQTLEQAQQWMTAVVERYQ